MHLTDRQRLLVRETLQDIEETPPPAEPGKYGWGLAVLGIVLLVGFGFLGPRLGMGPGLAMPVLIVGGGATVVGIVLAMTSGGFARGAASAAAEAGLRELEHGEDDEDVLLRAATLVVAHAYVAHGPTMTSTFDADEARRRIGERMPLVLAVEEYLSERAQLYPVFTLEDGEGSG